MMEKLSTQVLYNSIQYIQPQYDVLCLYTIITGYGWNNSCAMVKIGVTYASFRK